VEQLRRQVIGIQGKVKDHMDKPNDPAAKRLNAQIQALEDELQVGKKARSVVGRVDRIIDILKGDAKKARIMNYEHLELFVRWFEHLRETLKKLS